VHEGYFRGVLHCLRRGKTGEEDAKTILQNKKRVKIEKKAGKILGKIEEFFFKNVDENCIV